MAPLPDNDISFESLLSFVIVLYFKDEAHALQKAVAWIGTALTK